PNTLWSPSATAASTRNPEPRSAVVAGRASTWRTTGTWNSDPAAARTVLGLYTSTEAGESTTPSDPLASAERRIVPAFPGSRTSTNTATNGDGSPDRRSCRASRPTSTNRATATTPWG